MMTFIATRFKLIGSGRKFRKDSDETIDEICLEDRGHNLWAVTRRGCCYNTFGEWEWEPLPSSRTDEYLKRTRYTLEIAKEKALEAFKREDTK